jgi:hypothetical protein
MSSHKRHDTQTKPQEYISGPDEGKGFPKKPFPAYEKATARSFLAGIRRSAPAADAQVVVELLNKGTPGERQRVENLILWYRDLRNLVNPFKREEAKKKISDTLEDLLATGFRLVPRIDTETWRLDWHYEGNVDPFEAAGIVRLIWMGPDRFRRCENCSLWFYAKRSHMKFCRRGCQVEKMLADPEFKRRRAEHSREWRKTKKQTKRGGK